MYARLQGEKEVDAKDVAIPVVSAPGEIAQVDFGYVGKLYDPAQGVLRKAWVFVMVLTYSRHLFARIVFDQRVTTWMALHVEAFERFGGVVDTVVPDNLKAAVDRAAFGFSEEPALNRSYRELARHYGFKVDPTPPYCPEKKGGVEAGVKYVKRNFIAPREFADVHDANRRLDRWTRPLQASARRQDKLARCRELLGTTPAPPPATPLPAGADTAAATPEDTTPRCPQCGASLRIVEILPPQPHDTS